MQLKNVIYNTEWNLEENNAAFFNLEEILYQKDIVTYLLKEVFINLTENGVGKYRKEAFNASVILLTLSKALDYHWFLRIFGNTYF